MTLHLVLHIDDIDSAVVTIELKVGSVAEMKNFFAPLQVFFVLSDVFLSYGGGLRDGIVSLSCGCLVGDWLEIVF